MSRTCRGDSSNLASPRAELEGRLEGGRFISSYFPSFNTRPVHLMAPKLLSSPNKKAAISQDSGPDVIIGGGELRRQEAFFQ